MPSSTSSSSSAWRRLPAGLLLGLLLFAAGEAALWSSSRLVAFAVRYTPAGPDGDPLLSYAALRRLSEPLPAPPLLLLGSSQIREGLDCPEIEDRLGHPCRNLAISAGSPLDLLRIQAGYDAHQRNRLALIGIFPKVMHMEPKVGFAGPGAVAASLRGGGAVAIGADGWRLLSAGLLQSLSPTLRFKDALWEARGVVGGRLGEAWELRLPPAPKRLLADERPRPPIYFERRVDRIDPDTALGPWTGPQEAALDRLIELEARRGRPALVVDFPTRPGYETTLPEGVRRHYRALLERLGRREDARLIRAADLGPLELEDFQDFTHLSASGRRKLSERVADRASGYFEPTTAASR